MSNQIEANWVQEVAKLADQAHAKRAQETVYIEGNDTFHPHIVGPNGIMPIPESLLVKPLHLHFSKFLTDLESFCELVNEFKVLPPTRIYGFDISAGNPLLTAIFNGSGPGNPSLQDVQAVFHPKTTSEFDKWMKINCRWLTQHELVEFIEDVEWTVIEPASADLVKLVSDLQITKDWSLNSKIDRQSGSTKMQFTDENQTRDVKIPHTLGACMSVFEGSAPRDFAVALRYRTKGSSIEFQLELRKLDQLLLEVRTDVFKKVQDLTDIKVLF